MRDSPSRSLHGHLDLVCALDDLGQSILARQSFRAPIHLSKPWREGETLVVNMVNQTAGLLAGDHIDTRARVETGASLLLTTPSASRAHPTPEGKIALQQHFSIAAGARLEVFPEMLIPHRDTECSQKTVVEIESGGELLYIDVLAPGRVAMGESFQYRRLDWRTDISLGGRLVVRERSVLQPGTPNLAALIQRFPNAYYGSAFLVAEKLPGERDAFLRLLDLQSADFWIGISEIRDFGWVVKLLAADSLTMKKGIQKVRQAFYLMRGIAEPSLRKI